MTNRSKKLCEQSGVSRRQALKIGAQGIGLGILGGVSPLPPMFGAASTALAATPGKILVVFEWFGGYDGLSTFVPYGDDALYQQRPNVGVREADVIKVDDHFGFQKSMVGMHRLWDEGNAALIHGAGYDQPSFSHFASSSFWHTGAPNSGEPYGWYGRTADALDPKGTPNYLVNISATQTLAVRARDHVPVVFQDPNGFRRDLFHPQQAQIERIGTGQEPRNDTHRFLLDVNQSAREASALVRQAWQNYARTRTPDLRLLDLDKVVALIENDFPARLYYVRLRNSLFDTHVNQESPFDRQVQYCSDAVWGFFEEMKRLGKQDEVAILIHSEFGRRVPENTSLGTDHGTANVSFVLGGGVKGGQYGTPPSLTDLILGGNLQHTTDFRRVYATLIEEFLGHSKSEDVLGGKFETLDMFT
ncbi:MAG: DUF1501 domain-containing protein [Vicinamibacterales bacterium]|jgi:uncharacterized protein (DUF1501 family)|nr:DUF1501 domain-containing protein [Vicinamibacterales bacterium]